MTFAEQVAVLRKVREVLEEREVEDDAWSKAYGIIAREYLGAKVKKLPEKAEAKKQVTAFYQRLLDEKEHLLAATMQWPAHVFNAEVGYAKRAFDALNKKGQTRNKFFGATSTSKTYSAIAWHYLEWTRDPDYTRIVMIAVTETHLKQNAFGQIKNLHEMAVIKPDGIVSSSLYLGKRGGMSGFGGFVGLLIPQSDTGTGRLRGKKPGARPKKHPTFGTVSRVFVLVDESQDVSPGLYDDFGSVLSSQTEWDSVKITECGNPTSTECRFVQDARPDDGWRPDEQLETMKSWRVADIQITRFDGADSENVIAKKNLYPGIQTLDAFMTNLRRGENSFEFLVNSRGYPPVKDTSLTILSQGELEPQCADPEWASAPVKLMSADLSFEGADKTVLTVGRYGLLKGIRRYRDEGAGGLEVFKDELTGEPQPRLGLVIDQQFRLARMRDGEMLRDDLLAAMKLHGIKPPHFIIDGSGPGASVVTSMLRRTLREEGIDGADSLMDVKFNTAPTEVPLTNCNDAIPKDMFATVVDEMWFTVQAWVLARCVWFCSTLDVKDLFAQVSQRRQETNRGKRRIEPKVEFIKRYGRSPDEADSMILLPHLIRQTMPHIPGRLPSAPGAGAIFDPQQAVQNPWAEREAEGRGGVGGFAPVLGVDDMRMQIDWITPTGQYGT